MTTRVRQWGNSLAIRLPKAIAKKARLYKGGSVSIEPRGFSVVIKPVVKKETLSELIAQITQTNRRSETDWGKPVGKEIW